jgi:hypothetical protein
VTSCSLDLIVSGISHWEEHEPGVKKNPDILIEEPLQINGGSFAFSKLVQNGDSFACAIPQGSLEDQMRKWI